MSPDRTIPSNEEPRGLTEKIVVSSILSAPLPKGIGLDFLKRPMRTWRNS
jgi:hypothetical protein